MAQHNLFLDRFRKEMQRLQYYLYITLQQDIYPWVEVLCLFVMGSGPRGYCHGDHLGLPFLSGKVTSRSLMWAPCEVSPERGLGLICFDGLVVLHI